MRAYYDHDALLYQSSAGIAPGWDELGTEKRAWGYDAAWNGRVWDDGSLDVDVRYLSSAVGATASMDDRRSSSARMERLGESGAQANLVRTSARISKGFGAHQMHVGVKAGLYDLGREGKPGHRAVADPGPRAVLGDRPATAGR